MPCHRSWGILWLMRKSVVMTFSFTANAGTPPRWQNDIRALWGVLVCLLTNTKKLPSLPLPQLWLPCKWNPDASPRGQPQHLPRCSVQLTEDPGPQGWADAGKKTRSCCPQLAQVSVRPGTETWWLCCWAWLANSKKREIITKMLLKGQGDLGAVPNTLYAPYIYLYVMLLSGVYNLRAAFGMFSKQQCKGDDAGAGLFWLSGKEELLHCSRPYCWRSVSPTGSLAAWQNCALGWSNLPAPPPPGKPFSWR